MTTYTILIDGGQGGETEHEASTLKDAKNYAREWTLGGDWDTSSGTIWVDVTIDDEDGDTVSSMTVEIDPPEPECVEGESHDWRSPYSVVGGIRENPGVWGEGGGVRSTEVCACCGCYRHINTWAQRPDTGEQGLTSTNYSDADEASLTWVESRKR